MKSEKSLEDQFCILAFIFFFSINLVFNFSIFLSLELSKFVNSNFGPSFQSKS